MSAGEVNNLSEFADTPLKHYHGSFSILSPLGLFRFHAYFMLDTPATPCKIHLASACGISPLPFDLLMKILEGFPIVIFSSFVTVNPHKISLYLNLLETLYQLRATRNL